MSHRLRPLLFAVLLIVAAGGVFGWQWWSTRSAASAARNQLFADVETALAAGDRDSSELSRLVSKLRDLDPGDPAVRLALARIALLRKRYERAVELLERLTFGGGDLQEQRTAAAAWLGWHASAARDRAALRSMLQDALSFADAAASRGDSAADHFVGWQIALRLGDAAAQQRYAEALRQRHPESLEARTVSRLQTSGDLQQPLAPVVGLCQEWGEPPVELALMRGVLELQYGLTTDAPADLERAVARLDGLLQQAPNLVEVRHWAATGHFVLARKTPPGGEHDRHVALQNEQIDWLLANADTEDPRRVTWLQWRQD